jgi:hypothetical protein
VVASQHVTPSSGAFSPHQGDFFLYSETSDLGNGTGNYAGYSEHQTVTGNENVTGVSGNTASMTYHYSYDWSNSSGSTLSGSSGGPYTFSVSTFLYVNGTDNETSFGGVNYVYPSVWFAMNNSLPVGSNFTILNTSMKIISKNATINLPTEGVSVNSIFAQGTGVYERDDVYGQFNASYAWNAWYDPSTGFIIGYSYVEHDTNPDGDGFGYTDKLYVTSTSYPLSILTTPTTTTTSSATTSSSVSTITSSSSPSTTAISTFSTARSLQIPSWVDYVIVIVVIVVVATAIAFVILRRGKSAPPPSTGTPT